MDVSIMFKLLRQLAEQRQHEHWTRAKLEQHQAVMLKRLREFAYANSPFYQKFHRGLTDRPLSELPVLTKAMMMKHFDELVTDRSLHVEEVRQYAAQDAPGQRFQNRYWVNATSGSSGHPGFFLFDEPDWLSVLASFARGQEWSGVRINLTHRQRMATVASISPWHMSAQAANTVNSWWRPSRRFAASQPLQQTVGQLNEWQPEVLVAYASMVGILAEEQLIKRLNIHPQVVYSASELLTEHIRELAREAWGDEPFNQYVATEAGGIASEHQKCRHMHFYDDLVIVENVDEDYRPVPPGQYGAKLLVTPLFSRIQPLIRYELNDSVRMSAEPPACGLPFAILEGIQGRVEDALTLPSRSGGIVAVQPLVFTRIMDILPLSGWQVVQQTENSLVVLLTGVRDGLTDERVAEQLTQSLAKEGVRVPTIVVQRVTEIPKTAAGKAPLVQAYRTAV